MSGLLGLVPDFSLTDEDKQLALRQAMFNAGLGMMQGGWQSGLADGGQSYLRALQSIPQQRQKQYADQLKIEGDILGNRKTSAELGKFSREAAEAEKQQQFFAMMQNPGRAAMLAGGGPSQQNLQRAGQIESNPASMLSDPRMNIQALAAGINPKTLGDALSNTRPFVQDPGKYYDGQYLADPTKGVSYKNGIVAPMRGAQETQNALAFANKSGDLSAQLNYETAKLPYDVQRAGGIAGAEAAARDPYEMISVPQRDGTARMMPKPEGRAALQRQPNMYPQYGGGEALSTPKRNAGEQRMAKQVMDLGVNPDQPFATMSREQMLGTTQSPADQTQASEIAKGYAKLYEDMRSKANDAYSMTNKYKQINEMLGDFEGGKFSPTMTNIASAANSLGLKIDPKLANKEAARYVRDSMMGDFKSMLPGPMSDSDREFIKSIPPSETQSASGRSKILAVQEKITERAAVEHQMANKWITKYGKITPEFEQQLNYWRRNSNMFEVKR
jgi:hypothetical protein